MRDHEGAGEEASGDVDEAAHAGGADLGTAEDRRRQRPPGGGAGGGLPVGDVGIVVAPAGEKAEAEECRSTPERERRAHA